MRRPACPIPALVLLAPVLAWPACAENAAVQERSLSERVLAEGRRILANAKDSHYSHTTKVDDEAGSYAVDCSGLAALILKRVAPEHLAAIPKGERPRPRAVEFYEAFSKAPADGKGAQGWRRIERLMDAQPGDLIVWRKEEIKPGDSTGHVVLLDETPVEDKHGRIRVVVVDSTASPHAGDSRKDGESGVGCGTMWFDVDADGKPAGYRWKSRNGALHEAPIAIGRAVSKP